MQGQLGCKCAVGRTERALFETLQDMVFPSTKFTHNVRVPGTMMRWDIVQEIIETKECDSKEVIWELDGEMVNGERGGHFVDGSPYQLRDIEKQKIVVEDNNSVVRLFQPACYVALVRTQGRKVSTVREEYKTMLRRAEKLARENPGSLLIQEKYTDLYRSHTVDFDKVL